MTTDSSCRICKSPAIVFYQDTRTFYKCPNCLLIFTNDLPDKALEENHYKSQWKTTDPGFWKNQTDALVSYIQKYLTPRRILDFGAGSGEMTQELQRHGYQVTALEPMNDGYLKDQGYPFLFDVVVAVEVIEHLPNVWEELEQIEKVLEPEGIMVFSTGLTNPFIELPDATEHFKTWWYKDDPTHLSFFCNHTLGVMADMRDYTIDIYGDKLFVVRRGDKTD
jgi:SAM-dependent methyltransferase